MQEYAAVAENGRQLERANAAMEVHLERSKADILAGSPPRPPPLPPLIPRDEKPLASHAHVCRINLNSKPSHQPWPLNSNMPNACRTRTWAHDGAAFPCFPANRHPLLDFEVCPSSIKLRQKQCTGEIRGTGGFIGG